MDLVQQYIRQTNLFSRLCSFDSVSKIRKQFTIFIKFYVFFLSDPLRNMFINMMLFKHSKPLDGCNEYMFDAQETLQTVFIIVALICIPWMLLGKPLYIMCSKKNNYEVSNWMRLIKRQRVMSIFSIYFTRPKPMEQLVKMAKILKCLNHNQLLETNRMAQSSTVDTNKSIRLVKSLSINQFIPLNTF